MVDSDIESFEVEEIREKRSGKKGKEFFLLSKLVPLLQTKSSMIAPLSKL